MSILDGYELVKHLIGAPIMTITKNGITFNKASIVRMNAEYVVPMINEEAKSFAIVESDMSNADARALYKMRYDSSFYSRWDNKGFIKAIEQLMGWNIEAQGMRIEGNYHEEDHALIFPLDKAKPVK